MECSLVVDTANCVIVALLQINVETSEGA
jgi:hypothetical protein